MGFIHIVMGLAYNKYGLRGATTHECMDHYRPDHPFDESSFWWGLIPSTVSAMLWDMMPPGFHITYRDLGVPCGLVCVIV